MSEAVHTTVLWRYILCWFVSVIDGDLMIVLELEMQIKAFQRYIQCVECFTNIQPYVSEK